MAPRISFTPPLLNSATPWASSVDDLAALYQSPHTGAVTTRTSLLHGFVEDSSVHQKLLFPATGTSGPVSSLNTYGYSPFPLGYYLDSIDTIIKASKAAQTKPFIISVTGHPDEVKNVVVTIGNFAKQTSYNLLIEINLSCPNIAGKPPPAYSLPELLAYLSLLSRIELALVPVGLKTPPYTHDGQYRVLLDALKQYPDVISFITSTNTLGSSLHLSSPPSLTVSEGRRIYQPTLSSEAGTGIGGLGGASIHWLSLGNVATIRRLLDAEEGLRDIAVIGVGGVADRDGWERMLSVGAMAVAVGTALGDKGVGVFADIRGRECICSKLERQCICGNH